MIITIPQPPAGTNLGPTIQQAIDELNKLGGGMVHLPPSISGHQILKWQIDRPVLVDGNNLHIRGTHPRGTHASVSGYFSQFLWGFRTRAKDTPCFVNPNHWEANNTYLDSSAGTRYPIRTRHKARFSFLNTPADHGPQDTWWEGVKILTIDFGFVIHYHQEDQVNLFGIVNLQGQACPIAVWINFYEKVIAVQLGFTNDTTHLIRIGKVPEPGKPCRLSLRIDMKNANCIAWIDGKSPLIQSNYFPSGQTLHSNQNMHPMSVFGLTPEVYKWGATGGTYSHDSSCFGLKLSAEDIYYTDNHGNQARIDGQAINDHNRYFSHSGFFYLPMEELSPSDKLVQWRSPQSGVGYELMLNQGTESMVKGALEGGSIANMSLSSSGCPIRVGTVYFFDAHDNQFTGYDSPFVGYPVFVNYPTSMSNNIIDRGRRGMSLWRWTDHKMVNNEFRSYGKYAITYTGCNVHSVGNEYSEVENCLTPVRCLDSQFGGAYYLKDMWDYEFREPLESYIDAELHTAVPFTSVHCHQCKFGPIEPGRTPIRLLSKGAPTGMNSGGELLVTHCQWYGNAVMKNGDAVCNNAPGWKHRVEGADPMGTKYG